MTDRTPAPMGFWANHLLSLTEIKGFGQALLSPFQLSYCTPYFTAKGGLKHSGMFCFPEQMLFILHVHIAQAADVWLISILPSTNDSFSSQSGFDYVEPYARRPTGTHISASLARGPSQPIPCTQRKSASFRSKLQKNRSKAARASLHVAWVCLFLLHQLTSFLTLHFNFLDTARE